MIERLKRVTHTLERLSPFLTYFTGIFFVIFAIFMGSGYSDEFRVVLMLLGFAAYAAGSEARTAQKKAKRYKRKAERYKDDRDEYKEMWLNSEGGGDE